MKTTEAQGAMNTATPHLQTLRRAGRGLPPAALVMMITLALGRFAFAEQSFQGQVVGLSDGDTLTVLVERRPVKVRLAQIDTPESSQPYGTRARQALAGKVFGRTVTVRQETVDRYGRVVGQVLLEGRDINREMVREGHAWAYRQYLRDPALLEEERAAREARRGLWSLPEAQRTPPWEWRDARRSGEPSGGSAPAPPGPAAVIDPAAPGLSPACGTKRTCRQMASCREARFYLTQCGIRSLDGDNDGAACEALCR